MSGYIDKALEGEHAAETIARLREENARLRNALSEMIEDSDDVDDEKLPAIPAATIVRARQTLNATASNKGGQPDE